MAKELCRICRVREVRAVLCSLCERCDQDMRRKVGHADEDCATWAASRARRYDKQAAEAAKKGKP